MVLVKPAIVFDLIRGHSDTVSLHVLAVALRLVLGIVLLIVAGSSKYPLALQVLGVFTIVAAVVLFAIGRTNFNKLISWASGLPSSFGKVSGFFALLLGGFLIYAVS
jgi:uncharacterized membrane protein YidH (DUF202 family)